MRLCNRGGLRTILLATLALPAYLTAAQAPENPLVRIHYDMELASYCSLITPAVSSGFKRQLAVMIDQNTISPEQIDQARTKASVAVYREWQNRSLGGFKGWCRKEGAASVRRFTEAAG